MAYLLGKDAKIYYGTAGTTAATELVEVSDVTYDDDTAEIDCTTRASGGFKSTETGFSDITLTFTIKVKSGDTGVAAILTAKQAKTAIALLCLDSSGGAGIDGDFKITKMSRKEGLEDPVTYDCTAKVNTATRLPVYV